jgi:hypothetical protein
MFMVVIASLSLFLCESLDAVIAIFLKVPCNLFASLLVFELNRGYTYPQLQLFGISLKARDIYTPC